jgi:hypothetical protein
VGEGGPQPVGRATQRLTVLGGSRSARAAATKLASCATRTKTARSSRALIVPIPAWRDSLFADCLFIGTIEPWRKEERTWTSRRCT